MPVKDPTQRFSSRVENYIRYRPGYPPEVLEVLRRECGLTPNSAVADVASGTGIFTQLLLANGNRVFAVEPNPEMRKAGEQFLSAYPHFTCVAGSAEVTTLPDHCVDFVTAAQAAHWFNREMARREFARILKPAGWVVLLWNERRVDTTPFLREYEQLLLSFGTDYQEVRHERTTAEIDAFFAPAPFHSRVLPMQQRMDYPALEGRLLSSSYTPQADHPNYQSMLSDLRRIFDLHQKNGLVSLDYDTRLYFGQIALSDPE